MFKTSRKLELYTEFRIQSQFPKIFSKHFRFALSKYRKFKFTFSIEREFKILNIWKNIQHNQ